MKRGGASYGSDQFQSLKGSPGYGFTITALIAATIMGLIIVGFTRTASIHSDISETAYSGSQAFWAAIAGIEVGLVESIDGVYADLGTSSFYNSTVILDTTNSDDDGSSLPSDYWTRVTSRGFSGDAERRLRFLSVVSMKAVWGDVSIIESIGNTINVNAGFTLKDSLYLDTNFVIASGATMGTSGFPAHIFYKWQDNVTINGTHTYLDTSQHPYGDLECADFDTEPYDSLIAIAAAITGTSGNKFNGNKRWRNTTLDLSGYTDRTVYVKGKATFQGATITGGTSEEPGVIVATAAIDLTARSGSETIVDDNIIIVGNNNINMADATEFGTSHVGTLNEMFAQTDLLINTDVVAYGQLYCRDDIRLRGQAYGIAYAPDRFTFDRSTSYLEGAIFAENIFGSSGNDKLDVGEMNLDYEFGEEYFKTFLRGLNEFSLNEY